MKNSIFHIDLITSLVTIIYLVMRNTYSHPVVEIVTDRPSNELPICEGNDEP